MYNIIQTSRSEIALSGFKGMVSALIHFVYTFITPLTSIIPAHWFRARHMTCLSFARRRPCDSASVCRALVRRLAHGMHYPDARCVYEDDKYTHNECL